MSKRQKKCLIFAYAIGTKRLTIILQLLDSSIQSAGAKYSV